MAKFEAYGAAFQIGDGGGPEAFTTVAQVRTISGPGLTLDTIDVSTHDGGGWRDFIASLLDGGEVTLDLVWDPDAATHISLRQDLVNRTSPRNFKIVWPDATSTTWSIAGVVTRFEPNAPVDAELSAAVTIKLTQQPTLA